MMNPNSGICIYLPACYLLVLIRMQMRYIALSTSCKLSYVPYLRGTVRLYVLVRMFKQRTNILFPYLDKKCVPTNVP